MRRAELLVHLFDCALTETAQTPLSASGQLQSFVKVCNFSHQATCYAEFIGRLRPEASFKPHQAPDKRLQVKPHDMSQPDELPVDSNSAQQWYLTLIAAGIAVISVVLVLPPVLATHNSILYPGVSGLLGTLAGIVCYARSRARRFVSPVVALSLVVNVCVVLYMLFIWLIIYAMSRSAMH